MVLHRTVVVLVVMMAGLSWSQASPIEAGPDQKSTEIVLDTLQAELSESQRHFKKLSKELLVQTLEKSHFLMDLHEEPDEAWQYHQLQLWRQEQLLERNLETSQYVLDHLRKVLKTASDSHGVDSMLKYLQQTIRAIAEGIKKFNAEMRE